MKKLVLGLLPVADVLLAPFVWPAGLLLRTIRRAGVHRLPLCRSVLLRVGVFPVRAHYYEPQFDNRSPRKPFSEERHLPGIDWNMAGQLELLSRLTYAGELEGLPAERPDTLEYYLRNHSFEAGDAEYWYQLIRAVKPRRIFEIGSGHSTLMAIKANAANRREDASHECTHVCIEPYEMPWLEETGVSVLRRKVEEVELSFFQELEAGDVLFIDSSHVIRPEGDVLYEYLEILPTLREGVIVHIHDIFSPRNYPREWLADEVRFWNEQYLLEAFLSGNADWKVIGALNYLQNNHHEKLKAVAPYISRTRQPASFYIQKTG